MPAKRYPSKRNPRHHASVEPPIELPPAPAKPLPVIKVVGISGSGKSTLVRALRATGYDARSVSQEHSNVPTLWQQFDHPAYLIFLNVSLEVQAARRPDVTWSAAAHEEELRRLSHAREHADLRIDTDELSPHDVYQLALTFLTRQRVQHAPHPLEPLPPTGSATRPTPPAA
jgi:hypothetical protein